jgi:hypothetical protein
MFQLGSIPQPSPGQIEGVRDWLHKYMPQGVDLWPRLITASICSVVGVSLTRLVSRVQYLDRRSERLRLVGEASSILQLRQHMQAICSEDVLSEIVDPLRRRVDDFARENLLKVEKALRIETEIKVKVRPRNWLLRAVPFYQPARPWLWIHHALYFAALGSLLFPVWSALSGVHSGDYHDSAVPLLHALAERWAHILGAFLAAALFAWLGYVNESAVSAGPRGEPDCADQSGRLHRSWFCRLFLCFEPHGAPMWIGQVLYLMCLGLITRFIFAIFAIHGIWSPIGCLVMLTLGIVVFVPTVVFNLASNYQDMRRAQSATPGISETPVSPAAKIWRRVRFLLLFTKPPKWWLWLFQIPTYLGLLSTLSLALIAIAVCASVSCPWWGYFFVPLVFLPLVFCNLLIAFIGGILKVQSNAAAPVEVTS